MRKGNIIIIFISIAILFAFSFLVLNREEENGLLNKNWDTSEKEFIWVKTDSLSTWIYKITDGGAIVEKSSGGITSIRYRSKKYLLHEDSEGVASIREHLMEEFPQLIEESNDEVVISLESTGDFTLCPALIVSRVLHKRSNPLNQNK